MHKKLLFAIIASIAATNAYSDQVLTSRAYVDNGLATKQDKITAGTTGAVVTYNGIQDGQTQFTERAIYDGSATYDSTTDANKLITAGAVNTMTPSLPTGTANAAVTYDANGNIGGERRIDDSGGRASVLTPRSDEWLTSVSGVKGTLKYITSVQSASSVPSSGMFFLPVFSENEDTPTFGRVTVANSVEDLGTWSDNTNKVIPTWMAMDSGLATKQNKMTCTRWLDTPENPDHTDENCLLWELGN